MIKFTVPGRPVPQPRMTKKSKWVRPEAQRYLGYKELVGWVAKQAYKGKPITGEVAVKFIFYLKPRGKKPDLSNLTKAIEDALNKIIWEDDVQVAYSEATRIFSESEPERVEIVVEEVEKEAS